MEKIGVIIVSWNVARSLDKCLKSVFESDYHHVDVWVIDNNSSDDSVAVIKKYSRAKLIRNSVNLGFPKAVNQGIKAARGEYLLILNPDTRIPKDFFTKAVQFMQEHPDAGVMGPKLVDPDGTTQGSVFNEPSLFKPNKKYTPSSVRAVTVDSVSGACLILPRKTIAKVGRMTEAVFMYFEDMDYCRRIRKAGLKVYFNPQIEVVHEHGQSSRQVPTQKYRNLVETLIYPLRKLFNIPSQAESPERYRTEAGIWYNGWPRQLAITTISWIGQKINKL